MATKLKKAPNLNKQDQSGNSEIVLFIGAQAWDFAKQYQEQGQGALEVALSDVVGEAKHYPPIVITDELLENLNGYQIAPKKAKFIRLNVANRAEPLSNAQINLLCAQLVKQTQVESLRLYDEGGALVEDLSAYVARLRTDKESQQTAEIIAQSLSNPQEIHGKASDKELILAFLNWLKQPLGRDVEMAETLEYNGIYWQRLNDEMLVRKIMHFLDELDRDYTTTRLNRLAELAKNKAEIVPPQDRNLIGFQNGVINKQTGQFYAHQRDFYLRHIENYPCHPERLDTPCFDNWLAFVSHDDQEKARAVLAGMFMILTNRNDWHLFLEITGKARSGKSVMAEIASLINGEFNTGVITLKDMDEPTKRAMLLNKSLAYSPDQGYYKGDGSALKKITANEPLEVKLLYLNSFKARLGVVFMMTTNEAMLFTDRNGGVAERRVIIPFNRQVPFEKRDPQLMEKIQLEVYGIVNKLLAQFPDPNEAKTILHRYKDLNQGESIKRGSNHLIDFASYFELSDERPKKDALLLGSAHRLATNYLKADTLYSAYYLYCQCHNYKELNLLAFKHALADAFKEAGQSVDYSCKKSNGFLRTNVYWKDKKDAIREWTAEENIVKLYD